MFLCHISPTTRWCSWLRLFLRVDTFVPPSCASILGELQAKRTVIPAHAECHETKSEYWHCEDIQDTVEYEACRHRDFVSTFVEAPCDKVQEPEEDKDEGDDGVLFLRADTASRYTGPVAELASEEHVGGYSESIESPFVTGCDEGAS